MTFAIEKHVSAPDGVSLPLRFCAAEGDARGVVQINHGLAEHSARYARFAGALSAAGFHTFAHDHRGHGANIGPRHPRGMFASCDGHLIAISDVGVINTHIRAAHPDLPLIMLGHSMGGLITMNYVTREPTGVDGVAIWNSNVGKTTERRAAMVLLYMERMFKGSDVPSSLLPKMTFRAWGQAIPDHRTLFDWLSRDSAEVDAYIADPMCGFDASVAMWIDIFRMMQHGADDKNFGKVERNLPFHLTGGGADPATANGNAITRLGNRLSAMGFTTVNETIWPNTRHESLNEINRDTITQQFIDWLIKHPLQRKND